MTLLWQSSKPVSTAIIALVASGALPLPAAIAAVLGSNILNAGLFVSDGMHQRYIAYCNGTTYCNHFYGTTLLPFVSYRWLV